MPSSKYLVTQIQYCDGNKVDFFTSVKTQHSQFNISQLTSTKMQCGRFIFSIIPTRGA